MLTAAFSDYFRHRFGFAVFSICVAITGFGILISVHDDTKLQYGALFLVTMGTYTAMPIIVCWYNMNLGGVSLKLCDVYGNNELYANRLLLRNSTTAEV